MGMKSWSIRQIWSQQPLQNEGIQQAENEGYAIATVENEGLNVDNGGLGVR